MSSIWSKFARRANEHRVIPPCPDCGKPMRYSQYSNYWYCPRCVKKEAAQ